MKGLDGATRRKYPNAPEHVQSMPPFSILLVGAGVVLLIAIGLPWLLSSRYPETLKSKAADNMKARSSGGEQPVHLHVVRDGRPGPFPGAAAQRVTRQPAPRGARSIMATVLPIYGISIGAYVLFTMYKVFGGNNREEDVRGRVNIGPKPGRRQESRCKSGFSLFGQRKNRKKGRINQEDLQKLKEKIAETEQLMQKALADMAATVDNVSATEALQRQFESVLTEYGKVEGEGEGTSDAGTGVLSEQQNENGEGTSDTGTEVLSEQIERQNKSGSSQAPERDVLTGYGKVEGEGEGTSEAGAEVLSEQIERQNESGSSQAPERDVRQDDVPGSDGNLEPDKECQAGLRQRNVGKCAENQNDMHGEKE